ncbi:MAG TPA: hypothetical protein VHL58_05600 [Thermoanaerobaculia bacterium]|nr:hypothetical protein [Thermoanaerobaculia bacterium]
MSSERRAVPIDMLLIFLLAYVAASLFHHVHNAEFLREYPSMPAWLSRGRVYIAWLVVSAVGLVGYSLVRSRYQLTGLIVLGIYGVLGLAGLAHYGLAPLSAHTLTMNLTIWLEVATALLLLTAVVNLILKLLREDHESAPE